MSTINISIPSQLKTQTENLVDLGFYSSFSDAVRDALRKLLEQQKTNYDFMAEKAIQEHNDQKGTVLTSAQDIDAYISNL